MVLHTDSESLSAIVKASDTDFMTKTNKSDNPEYPF